MTGPQARVAMMIAAAMIAGCAATPEVAIRAVGGAAAITAGGDHLALGRAALALGNAGIALQQFRQALRAAPDSVAALDGIAQSYEAIGRADLARRYYEEALALAPVDTRLLHSYADALGRQGATAEAKAVIGEIALRTHAPAAQWVVEPAPPVPAPLVSAPPAPPRPARVRLERLSLGEIALVTTPAPLWRALRPVAMTSARTVRADRLGMASDAPSVRLLNAARRDGLAGRSAGQLHEAGWRRLAIGDAARARWASVIFYPAERGSEARALGKRLHIDALRIARRHDILILLGRDSA